MASVRLVGVSKRYPGGFAAVAEVDLQIDDGELFVLVGPSGCGKSTLLRLIAGLEWCDGGQVFFGERDVTTVPPRARNVAMVFQDYALYPHKTVRDNLGFGLRMRGVEKPAIDARVRDIANLLGLAELLSRKPHELSGGQRQRVALGRAIVRDAEAFLLDEPLSNLDAKLRVQTRTDLLQLKRRFGSTMVYVTHDQEEAMTLGDRVGVMNRGVLVQVAPPRELYRRPASTFVASFVGSPEINLLPGQVTDDGRAKCEGMTLPLPVAFSPGREVILGIRPHEVFVTSEHEADVRAPVEVRELLGASALCHVKIGGQRLRVLTSPEPELREGDIVPLAFPREALHVFDKTGARLGP